MASLVLRVIKLIPRCVILPLLLPSAHSRRLIHDTKVYQYFLGRGETGETRAGGGIKGEIIGAVSKHNLRLITVLKSPPTSDRRLLPFAVVGTRSGAARPSTAAATLPRPRTVRSHGSGHTRDVTKVCGPTLPDTIGKFFSLVSLEGVPLGHGRGNRRRWSLSAASGRGRAINSLSSHWAPVWCRRITGGRLQGVGAKCSLRQQETKCGQWRLQADQVNPLEWRIQQRGARPRVFQLLLPRRQENSTPGSVLIGDLWRSVGWSGRDARISRPVLVVRSRHSLIMVT
ncbi:hypothetical protein E2C01_025590 [Portunus trituberculatus]|uniref:Secreted protein n=1 Tax=Portunus trituberculatus TaxID=210409 RepID=A0A5B7EDR7_PORTR|nr:hypothetical protein [Portunus trituberculatus]